MSLTIWSNAKFTADALARLREGTRQHRLIWSQQASASVLAAGGADPDLATADIALGQPDAAQCLTLPRLRWIELSSAGYTRYDTPEFRETLAARPAVMTNMSGVFAEPCAQHAMAMMLGLARQLLPSYRDQLEGPRWEYFQRRADSTLLGGQTVLLLSYGTIARRLVELLAPYRMKIFALRRSARSEAGVHIIPEEKLSAVLPQVDHLINILPENDATLNYVNARRLAQLKPTARFYNIGRGTTVDQRALQEALESGRLNAAYLDVTDPEPLPPAHPLWSTPRCYITPHTAGGRADQDDAIITHFLANLAAYERHDLPAMTDRVV
jgi:phosphoglycerate dehydrogenase-like enzyme